MGIRFDEDKPYTVADNGNREVAYAEKKEIMDGIVQKYHPEWLIKEDENGEGAGGVNQAASQNNEPRQTPPNKPKDKNNGGGQGTSVRLTPRADRQQSRERLREVNPDGQA